MSATGTRLALADADAIAAELLGMIDGEAFVVGSVRRRQPQVGDVEILVHRDAGVALPIGGLFSPETYRTVKGGTQDWRLWQVEHVMRGYRIDLWRFDNENRGSLTVMRTGPEAFSVRFVIGLRARGLYHAAGYVRTLSGVYPVATEREALRLAGMSWVEPADRQ